MSYNFLKTSFPSKSTRTLKTLWFWTLVSFCFEQIFYKIQTWRVYLKKAYRKSLNLSSELVFYVLIQICMLWFGYKKKVTRNLGSSHTALLSPDRIRRPQILPKDQLTDGLVHERTIRRGRGKPFRLIRHRGKAFEGRILSQNLSFILPAFQSPRGVQLCPVTCFSPWWGATSQTLSDGARRPWPETAEL